MTTQAPAKRRNGQAKKTLRVSPRDVEINLERLDVSADSFDFITQHFQRPEIEKSAVDGGRGGWFIYNFIQAFVQGLNVCYVPVVDGRYRAGMFFGCVSGKAKLECHQGIYNEFKGFGVASIRMCIKQCFDDFDTLTHLVGYIPVHNRPSLLCAKHGGFDVIGKMPNHQVYNGFPTDAWIVVKERD